MAAQSVLKLKVDSSEYNSKIQRATTGLMHLSKSLKEAGKSFSDADKDQVAYISELGKMQTASNSARGRVTELTKAFVELSAIEKNLTEQEKQSAAGQALSKSLVELKQRAIDAKKELHDLNTQLEPVKSGSILGRVGNLGGMLGGGKMTGILQAFGGSMLPAVGGIASLTGAVTALGAAMRSNIETARNFEKSMSMLSSLTGKTGEDLERLKEYAIELGSTTTLSASQVADAFRLIGSQQPQLLESSEALKSVTKNAITLSEAAGIELATAAQTLSTSINQMGGDSSNAERFINVLAAASQKGAGDIAWLGEAITKSGTTAKMVGTSYEQLVANLEQLAQAGFDASTAGTALRSIIVNLEKQSDDNLKPSVVGLTEAFANLEKKHLSVGEMANLVGKMFGAQAAVLAENAAKARELEEAITGTSTAEDQARTNTDNLEGSLKSLSSAWEGFNLHLNSSNGFLRDCVDWMTKMVQQMDAFVQSGELSKSSSQYWIDSLINIKDAAHNAFIELQKMLGVFPDDPESFAKMPANTGVSWRDNSFNFQSILGEEGVVVTAPKGGGKKPVGGGGGGGGKKSGGRTTKVTPPAPAGSVAALNKELADFRKKQELATDTSVWENFQKKIDETTAKIALLKGDVKFDSKELSRIGKDEIEVPGKVYLKKTTEQDIKDQLDQFAPKDPFDIEVDVNFKDLQKIEDLKLKETMKAAQMAANAVSSIGDAFSSIEDPSAKAAGMVMQAIASIALGFAQASAQPNTAGTGWGWLAWLAAGATAMATTISTIHSLTNLSEGGFVPGNSYSGDNIPGNGGTVGLNSGELVLNRSQQNNLANALQGGPQGIDLRAVVSGEQIVLVANRSLKRRGKGELVTWK